MSYPEYKPDTDPYNRVWRYEYDQVSQENERLQLKLSKIKSIVCNAQRNKIASDYGYVLRQIAEIIEV
jgi:hypothetical protein